MTTTAHAPTVSRQLAAAGHLRAAKATEGFEVAQGGRGVVVTSTVGFSGAPSDARASDFTGWAKTLESKGYSVHVQPNTMGSGQVDGYVEAWREVTDADTKRRTQQAQRKEAAAVTDADRQSAQSWLNECHPTATHWTHSGATLTRAQAVDAVALFVHRNPYAVAYTVRTPGQLELLETDHPKAPVAELYAAAEESDQDASEAVTPISREQVEARMLAKLPAKAAREITRWRTPGAAPATADEVTESMLHYARKCADESWCPQTVWPSHWVGRDFQGKGLVVTSSATGTGVPLDKELRLVVPVDAYPGTEPLLTVLPSDYHKWNQSTHEYATVEAEPSPAISAEHVASGAHTIRRTEPGTWQMSMAKALFTIHRAARDRFTVHHGTRTTSAILFTVASLRDITTATRSHMRANSASNAAVA